MGIFSGLGSKKYEDSELLKEKGITPETLENLSNNAGDDDDEEVVDDKP